MGFHASLTRTGRCGRGRGVPTGAPAAKGVPTGRKRGRQGDDVLRRLGRERRDLPRQPPHRSGRDPRPRRKRRERHGDRARQREPLIVAGASTGKAYVYDAQTGALIRTYTLATAPTFINDVVVTRTGAYFTDSQKAVLYRIPIGVGGALGNVQTIPLAGRSEEHTSELQSRENL